MTKIFETTSNIRYASKKRPKSLLTPVPPIMRDFLELTDKSIITWKAEIDENGYKYIKISKLNKEQEWFRYKKGKTRNSILSRFGRSNRIELGIG